MKPFHLTIALAVLLFMPLFTLGQSSSKTVVGSFIYKYKVYNLDFKELSLNSYQLTISGFPNDAKGTQPTASKKPAETTKKPVSGTPKDTTQKDTTHNAQDTTKQTTDATAADDNKAEKEYIFSELSQKVFITVFTEQMTEKFNVTADNEINNLAISEFTFVKDNLGFQDDEPVTAYLKLKSDEIYSFIKANASPYYTAALSYPFLKSKIDHVDVETQDGAIKNIQVFLIYDPNAVKDKQADPSKGPVFKNLFPISISSKFDPDRFANIKLYSFNCNGIKGLTRYIKLSDVLDMRLVLANNKEDYSPSDRLVNLSPALPVVELKKEKRSRILEVNAFTDFVGLDQEQPNGLIQIEAKRKINLNTRSWPFFIKGTKDIADKYNLNDYNIEQKAIDDGKHTLVTLKTKKLSNNSKEKADTTIKITKSDTTIKYKIKNIHLHSSYFGIFTYMEPKLLFSKLDGNNRNYLLDSSTFVGKKLNPLKNYQYQLASFGFNLNMVKFSFPDLKFSWNVLDAGVNWYRSRVQAMADTNSKHSTPLNNGTLNLSSRMDFHSDSRWGAGFIVGRTWQHLWNNDYKLPVQAGLWQAGFDGFLITNDADNSKLFFRFRWTGDAHHFNTNFTQIQLGYSLNIFTGTSAGK